MYGDTENIGLVSLLVQRLGIMMLSKLLIFMSEYKLRYFCLPVFGNIFSITIFKEENRKYYRFTVKDNKPCSSCKTS